MKKGGGSESTIIIGPSKSVLVYALNSLEYVIGLARFRVFVPNLLIASRIVFFSNIENSINFKCNLEKTVVYKLPFLGIQMKFDIHLTKRIVCLYVGNIRQSFV